MIFRLKPTKHKPTIRPESYDLDQPCGAGVLHGSSCVMTNAAPVVSSSSPPPAPTAKKGLLPADAPPVSAAPSEEPNASARSKRSSTACGALEPASAAPWAMGSNRSNASAVAGLPSSSDDCRISAKGLLEETTTALDWKKKINLCLIEYYIIQSKLAGMKKEGERLHGSQVSRVGMNRMRINIQPTVTCLSLIHFKQHDNRELLYALLTCLTKLQP